MTSDQAAQLGGNQPVVLFVCQHGAAKSVLAAELLGRSAHELGFSVETRAGGVDPAETVADGLLQLLPERAPELRVLRPRRVSREDIEGASITITFNVDLDELPAAPRRHVAWDDVPAVSEDPTAASASIARLVAGLIERLRA